MSRIQRFLHWILPKSLFGRIEAESKQWFFICPQCGYSKSYWDAGGIRAFAKSYGKRIYAQCPKCQQKSWFKVDKLNK